MMERAVHRISQISRLCQVRWKDGHCVDLNAHSTFYLLRSPQHCSGFFMWHFHGIKNSWARKDRRTPNCKSSDCSPVLKHLKSNGIWVKFAQTACLTVRVRAVRFHGQGLCPRWPVLVLFLQPIRTPWRDCSRDKDEHQSTVGYMLPLPVLSPRKEALCLQFPALLFLHAFALAVKCHSGCKFSLKQELWVSFGICGRR